MGGRDRDGPEKDGKLSFDEFFLNLYDELRDFGEHDPVESAVRSHVNADPKERQQYAEAIDAKKSKARSKFDELDTNKDGCVGGGQWGGWGGWGGRRSMHLWDCWLAGISRRRRWNP